MRRLSNWVRLVNYLETVARRTHENLPVALTFVIRRRRRAGRYHAAPVATVFRPPGGIAVHVHLSGRRFRSAIDSTTARLNGRKSTMPRPTISIPSSCIRSCVPWTRMIWSPTSPRAASWSSWTRRACWPPSVSESGSSTTRCDFENSLANCLGHRERCGESLGAGLRSEFQPAGGIADL